MNNNENIGGFQFVVSDSPDLLSYLNVLTTDRTSTFTVSAAEGEQGVTVVGFSLTGGTIPPGEGVLITVFFDASSFDTEICFDGVVTTIPSNSSETIN